MKREHKPLSRSGGIIAPILACFCSVLLKIPYSIYAVSYVARILQFTAIIVIISNVSYPDFRGKVNGIGQVFASLGRFIVRKDLGCEF